MPAGRFTAGQVEQVETRLPVGHKQPVGMPVHAHDGAVVQGLLQACAAGKLMPRALSQYQPLVGAEQKLAVWQAGHAGNRL